MPGMARELPMAQSETQTTPLDEAATGLAFLLFRVFTGLRREPSVLPPDIAETPRGASFSGRHHVVSCTSPTPGRLR
jgi:hypothetical protein